jgi:N-acetylglucosaminyldiphosphoundecaprenol N-acetyl-beta-D-mannosaminyltransferase
MDGKINIRGVNFNDVSMDEATEICRNYLIGSDGSAKVIHTPNAEIVQLCVEKPEFTDIINSADLIIPDGSGVIMASKILKSPLQKGRVPGVELGDRLAESAAALGCRLFLLGGKAGVAELAAQKLKEKYADIIISGVNDGYFKDDEAVIKKINDSGTDLLYVCTGSPRQEVWMSNNKHKLHVKLMGGFGGSLDIYAGTVKRAPLIFRKTGMEWFYRLIKEPTRIKRMMKLPKFICGTYFSKR